MFITTDRGQIHVTTAVSFEKVEKRWYAEFFDKETKKEMKIPVKHVFEIRGTIRKTKKES